MSSADHEARFLDIIGRYRPMMAKICWMYAGDDTHEFNDLWQEVMVNLWQGLKSFRGEAQLSTWLYRLALNTCLTQARRTTRRHTHEQPLEAMSAEPIDLGNEHSDSLKQMYALIGALNPVEKALIMMWLDEKSYDEIAEISGLARNTVATRLRRIKLKLIGMSDK